MGTREPDGSRKAGFPLVYSVSGRGKLTETMQPTFQIMGQTCPGSAFALLTNTVHGKSRGADLQSALVSSCEASQHKSIT